MGLYESFAGLLSAHCYAETLSSRYGHSVWGPKAERRTFGAKHWDEPRRWNAQAEKEGRRVKVFSSSMCDIFEDHPTIEREREKLWDLIRETPWIDWQLLTKRADRIADNLPSDWGFDSGWHNVWLGVSIENMDYAWRAAHLSQIPAVVRFISFEPALGPLDDLSLRGISWVIYGGESGAGYRAHDLDWPRVMLRKCAEAECAFFYKQSSAPRTEMGIELDGRIVRFWPTPRQGIIQRPRSAVDRQPLPMVAAR